MIKRNEISKHRSKELTTLELVKKQEAERKKKGYIWVTKDKTSKQIAKENLESHLSNGWVKSSQ